MSKSTATVALPLERQFSLAYLLAEVALVATALAAARAALFPMPIALEARAILFCVMLVAACGALGGLVLRMAVGLIGGGIFAVASIPLVWLLLTGASL
jgi:hypothetical protein